MSAINSRFHHTTTSLTNTEHRAAVRVTDFSWKNINQTYYEQRPTRCHYGHRQNASRCCRPYRYGVYFWVEGQYCKPHKTLYIIERARLFIHPRFAVPYYYYYFRRACTSLPAANSSIYLSTRICFVANCLRAIEYGSVAYKRATRSAVAIRFTRWIYWLIINRMRAPRLSK